MKNNKCGFVNREGKEIVPCKYDSISILNEGLSIIKLNSKYGFVNEEGIEVVPCVYDCVFNFNNGIAIVKLNSKYGFINKEGKEIVPCKYDSISILNEGLSIVKLNSKYGFINKEGKEIVSCIYDTAYNFNNGLSIVKLNSKYGFIDLNESKEFIEFTNYIINIGSRKDTLYYTKYNNTYILATGCFIGTLKEFEEAVNDEFYKEDYPDCYNDYMKVINDLKNNI